MEYVFRNGRNFFKVSKAVNADTILYHNGYMYKKIIIILSKTINTYVF